MSSSNISYELELFYIFKLSPKVTKIKERGGENGHFYPKRAEFETLPIKPNNFNMLFK